MKNAAAVLGTGLTALALTLAAAGCGSNSTTDGKATTEATTSAAASATTSAAAPTPAAPAAGRTLDDYLKENNIQKTSVTRGEPGPTIDIPVPEGWAASPAGPDASYGGIVFKQPVSKDDPPRINANLVKLTGNVDPAQVLALAAAGLKAMPGFESLGDSQQDELGGFQATQSGGSYTKDGNSRLIAQKSVVIPAEGGVFLLQLTADGLESDMGPLMDATSTIDKETRITP